LNVDQKAVLDTVNRWFEKSVLGLNLCPFAVKPFRDGRIRFELSTGQSDEDCLSDLLVCLHRLDQQPEIETMVLICAGHLQNFSDYNQFLDLCDDLLELEERDGIYQIASFHPHYQFAGSQPGDRANWTNRSPYPLLHLLREASITKAVTAVSDSAEIPARNITTLEKLSDSQMMEIYGSR